MSRPSPPQPTASHPSAAPHSRLGCQSIRAKPRNWTSHIHPSTHSSTKLTLRSGTSYFHFHSTLLDGMLQATFNLSLIFCRESSRPKTGHYASSLHPAPAIRLTNWTVLVCWLVLGFSEPTHPLPRPPPRARALPVGHSTEERASPRPSLPAALAVRGQQRRERESHLPSAPSSPAPSSPSRRCPCPGSRGTRSGGASCACGGAASPPASSSGAWAT